MLRPARRDRRAFPSSVNGDNLETGSFAAAHGGITTLVAFVYAYKGLEIGQAIDEFLAG